VTDHCWQLVSIPRAGRLASCKLLRLCIANQLRGGKRRGPRHAAREPCCAVRRGLEIPDGGFYLGLQLYPQSVGCMKSCSVIATGVYPVMMLSQPPDQRSQLETFDCCVLVLDTFVAIVHLLRPGPDK